MFTSKYISVNCWFCSKNYKIEKELYNSWICPGCEQYNGFTKDGDYNKPIGTSNYANNPDLRNKKYNSLNSQLLNGYKRSQDQSFMTTSQKLNPLTPDFQFSNGLCESCNEAIQYKYQTLRDIQNKNGETDYYDSMKTRLDNLYPLCPACQMYLDKKIRADSSLIPTFYMGGNTRALAMKFPNLRNFLLSSINLLLALAIVFLDVCLLYPDSSKMLLNACFSNFIKPSYVSFLFKNPVSTRKNIRRFVHLGCLTSLLSFMFSRPNLVISTNQKIENSAILLTFDTVLLALAIYRLFSTRKTRLNYSKTQFNPTALNSKKTHKVIPNIAFTQSDNEEREIDTRLQSFSLSSKPKIQREPADSNVFLRRPKLLLSNNVQSIVKRPADSTSTITKRNNYSAAVPSSTYGNFEDNNYSFLSPPSPTSSFDRSPYKHNSQSIYVSKADDSISALTHSDQSSTCTSHRNQNLWVCPYESKKDHNTYQMNPYLDSHDRLYGNLRPNLDLQTYTRCIINEIDRRNAKNSHYASDRWHSYNVLTFFILGICLGINTLCAWLFFKDY